MRCWGAGVEPQHSMLYAVELVNARTPPATSPASSDEKLALLGGDVDVGELVLFKVAWSSFEREA
jgi:hypothetical protein